MFIYQIKLNSREKSILKKKLGMILVLLFFSLSLGSISGTNSFFTDSVEVKGIEFQAGVWIPTLTMTIEPSAPDGEDETYTEAPCVKLFSDIDDVTIHYSFSGEIPSEGTVLEYVCLYPPEGESELIAWAVNNENEDWISETLTQKFNVEWIIKEGDVVINELMWMGSAQDSRDEWIELRNMTDRDIDLSNWDIVYGRNGKESHIEIPHGYMIKADDYFLITAKKWDETEINLDENLDADKGKTHVSSMDLSDAGEKLILRNKKGSVIDKVWKDEKWPDGEDGESIHMSMERKDDAPDGELESSWYTCLDDECNDDEYWREEGLNFGTPGKKNLGEGASMGMSFSEFEEKIITEESLTNPIFEEIYNKNFKKEKPNKNEAPQTTNPSEKIIPEENFPKKIIELEGD